MASEWETIRSNAEPSLPDVWLANGEPGQARLLMQAFETFTHASTSLESAFSQLQAHAQRLTEELAAKNAELETSLREKQEAQNYLRTILERLPCGVFVLDEKGELALCNPMASEVLEEASRKESISGRNRRLLTADMRNCLAMSASSDGTKEFEVSVGKRTLATSGTLLTDENGAPVGALHIVRDITEMKALQEQNKRIERLSAMGEMAAELAHEIRNPLGSIELYASLLVRDLSGDQKRWAENARIGIRSLNTIVSNMLQFANPSPVAFAPVNVHDIVNEVLRFTDPLMQQRQVEVRRDLGADQSAIPGDADLLKQLMLNLVFNAMKAMPSQGALSIRTRNLAGGELELQIRDTGVGIPPENLERIFDPFFTTNRNGTGLGLSVVHQIVERHSGRIEVASEVNRGATFTIVFNETEKE